MPFTPMMKKILEEIEEGKQGYHDVYGAAATAGRTRTLAALIEAGLIRWKQKGRRHELTAKGKKLIQKAH
jgi:predicted transcriptional regulator